MKFKLIISFVLGVFMMSSAQSVGYIKYRDAVLQAKNEDKVLVVQFAGSDWCSPCIRLEDQVLDQTEFVTYKEKFVWIKADFPRKKANRLSAKQQEQNDFLAEKYNIKGSFPLLVFIDTDEKIIGTIGYQAKSTTEYIALIEKIIAQ